MTVVAGPRVEHGWTPKLPTPVIIAVLAVIVVAAAVAAVVVSTSGGEETSQAVSSAGAVTPAASTQAAPDLRSDQTILAELANRGYIASAAVDWRQLNTEELVRKGLVPAQTLEPYLAPSEPLFSESGLLTMELARSGQIPMQTVDWRQFNTEELVRKGLIPAETLEPYLAPSEPLFSESELLTMELARSGQIPMQAVDWEAVEMKKLVNEGFIPRQALED